VDGSYNSDTNDYGYGVYKDVLSALEQAPKISEEIV